MLIGMSPRVMSNESSFFELFRLILMVTFVSLNLFAGNSGTGNDRVVYAHNAVTGKNTSFFGRSVGNDFHNLGRVVCHDERDTDTADRTFQLVVD